MKIALGSDHAGFALKEQLQLQLRSQSHQVLDVGTSSNEAVDYPEFARAVAERVASGDCERGIMVDGAGIGSAMAAGKVPGVRAALAYDLSSARNSRQHNDANVLTLGAGLIGPVLAWQIVQLWLDTPCTEERHLRRVAMIETPPALPDAGGQEKGLRAAVPADSAGRATSPAGSAHFTDAIGEDDIERILRELEPLLTGRLEGAPAPPPGVAANPETARRFLALGAGRLSAGPLGADRQARSIPEDIAACIDHTLLKADATADQVRALCAEAREHRFAAVCVNPVWVRLVSEELQGSGVRTCSVVGFPLGATPGEGKALEARRAIREGAREIDMVINVGALKGGDDPVVLQDIRSVVEACRDGGAVCKVIIETALLTGDEKRRACRLARQARAHFVKTSTGFGPGGATADDVALMAAEVREAGMEVKASGGIRSYEQAREMIDAGATRIGCSASVAIVEEARELTVSA